MKLFFDYQIFSLQNVGGISRYFIELAHRLPSHDKEIDTTVLAPVHINEYLHQSSVRKIGVKVCGFPGKHHVLGPLNRISTKILLKLHDPDIIHETYYSPCSVADDIPRVLTVYDMIHERYPDQFTGPDQLVAELKAEAVSRADHIITISQSTRSDLLKYLKVPEKKVSVIPLAASLGNSGISGMMEQGERPYLLYVGLRGGVKNFKRLLNAYVHSGFLRKEFDLICVGGGSFSGQEFDAIRSAKVVNQVRQLQADDKVLKALYRGAVLFVYPSLHEGFGLPLLEAMRCGCPVVCSNTSSMPEIAGDAALYFDPENEEEIKSVLEFATQSEEKRSLLRERGYVREKLFSWEACITKTAEVYKNLL